MKITERQVQMAYFQWVRLMRNSDPLFYYIYHIPNQGDAGTVTWWLKRRDEGAEPGLPDVNIDYASRGYIGARFELKIKPNKLSKNQRDWLKRFKEAGYYTKVVWSFDELRDATNWYLRRQNN